MQSRHVVSFVPTTYIVINNFKEKEIDLVISQLIETKQSVDFSSQLIQVGLFKVFEQVPLFVFIPIHTRTCLKHMMRCKGKEVMEEIGFFGKISWKQTLVEGIHTRTCLKHMMQRKGKEVMEEIGSFGKISWKQTLVEGKEI